MGILLTTSPSSLSVSTGGPPNFEPSCCTDWSNNVSLLKPLPIMCMVKRARRTTARTKRYGYRRQVHTPKKKISIY